jgi:hypothetical protein
VWGFDVVKSFTSESGGDDVAIRVEGIDGLPPDMAAVLVDRRLGRAVELRERGALHAYIAERAPVARAVEARFAVVVGSRAFVDAEVVTLYSPPRRTALFQNRPNPFNPSTVIRYDLDRAARVSLRIYDVRGALVRTLEERDRPAGRYEIGWDGENDGGERVASGVYFCRLVTDHYRATRKLVLVE